MLLSCERQCVACKLFTELGHGTENILTDLVEAKSIHILEPQRTPSYNVFVHVTWAAVSNKKKRKEKVLFRGLI